MLAGSIEAVATALLQLQHAAAGLGLTLNLAKSEAIAVGMTPPPAIIAKLPAALVRNAVGQSRILDDFEFLGAAIGKPAHLQSHAALVPASCLKFWGAWQILKSPCGCCVPPLGMLDWYIPCVAALLLAMSLL